MIKVNNEKKQIWLMLNLNEEHTLGDLMKELSRFKGMNDYKLIIKQGIWKA